MKNNEDQSIGQTNYPITSDQCSKLKQVEDS